MLAHPVLDGLFSFDNGCVNTMVIEDPVFFREFLRDILMQIDGHPGQAVLSEQNAVIPFSGNAELIDDVYHFQINRKTLQSRILSWLEREAVSESFYLRTAELTAALEQLIIDLSFDLPCDTVCSKISIGNLLKSAGIEVLDDYQNDLERILDYMELVRQFDRRKLFVLVNLRSFYSGHDLTEFFSAVVSREHRVFPVDGTAGPLLPLENRVTIDKDLCEF